MFHFPKHLADRQTQNNSVLILSKFPMINFWPPAILKEDFLQDLPMVCFVVTQHSESALSLCLRYSKTSSVATKKILSSVDKKIRVLRVLRGLFRVPSV